jgi:hypothetical protein
MQTATLVKLIRDPRSGEVHLPKERVAILGVIHNLNRTLLKVRWESGGGCVIFPDDVDETTCLFGNSGEREELFQATGMNN